MVYGFLKGAVRQYTSADFYGGNHGADLGGAMGLLGIENGMQAPAEVD